MKKQPSKKELREWFIVGRAIRSPLGKDEIFLEWGKIGAWITSGGIDGAKQFVTTEALMRANFTS